MANPFDQFDAQPVPGKIVGAALSPGPQPQSANPFDQFDAAPQQPASPAPAKPLAWSDVPGQALANAPASAVNLGKAVVAPILHPIDTFNSLKDLGAGIASKVYGAVGGEQDPAVKAKSEAVADALGKHFKDRYGSIEGVKHALATDPIGIMADASIVLTGGGSAAARVPGVIGEVGNAVRTAGSVLDPIQTAGRAVNAVGRGVAEGLGVATGAGARPFQEAFQAGKAGNTTLTDNMRGNRPLSDAVDMAENAVGTMGRERSTAYNANMANVKSSTQSVDFQPVIEALDRTRAMAVYTSPTGKAIVKSQPAFDVHTQLTNLVNDFMTLPVPERTPAAMDALKQGMNDVVQATKQGTTERTIANDLYRTVRGEITKQVPDYANAMRDYTNASDAIGEMRKTMSINDRASTDTTLRKLQSTMRNNVNTNFGERERLLDTLARHEPNLPPALAGQALNALAPRGLARISPMTVLATGGASMNPLTLGMLPFTSPRLMGEATYGAGRAAGLAGDAASAVGASPARLRAAARNSYIFNALTNANPQ